MRIWSLTILNVCVLLFVSVSAHILRDEADGKAVWLIFTEKLKPFSIALLGEPFLQQRLFARGSFEFGR